jgi:hypothetical protein
MLVLVKTLGLAPAVCALFFLACSSSSGGNTQPTTDSGKDTKVSDGTGDVVDDTPPVVPCSEAVEDRPAGSVCVRRVKGSVVDDTGKALADLVISVCGSICFYGKTGADGTFDTEVGHYINVDKFAALVHGRPDHGSLYVVLSKPDAGDVVTLADKLVVPALPATAGLPALATADGKPTAATLTSGGITFTFPAGLNIDRDIEDISLDSTGDKGKAFRVAKGDVTNPPPFGKGQNLAGLWVLSPFDAKFNDGKAPAVAMKVGVSVANPDKTKLTAGMLVEFVVMGDELVGTPFTGGILQHGAYGKVSGDASKIDTDAGDGISYMTWLGVRPKP